MFETRDDILTLDIDNMLNSSSYTPSKPSIFRVGDHLRSLNPEAYDPRIIAIGPFHRNKPHVQNMEQHKLRYLRLLLQRKNESSVERYVTAVRQLEDAARKCYAEDIDLDKDQFVKMLILDGCFIVEFLLKRVFREYRDGDDPIFSYGHIRNQLVDDLLLFENQIPFFIVDCLFKMITDTNKDIKCIIWPLVRKMIFRVPFEDFPEFPINEHHLHLLGILHDINCSPFVKKLSKMNSGNPNNMVKSGEELKEAGISSKKSKGDSFFHWCCSFTASSSKKSEGEELKEAGSSSKKLEGVSFFHGCCSFAGSSSKKSEGDGFFHKCSYFAKTLSKMNSENPNKMVYINLGEELKEAGSSSEKSEGVSFFHGCCSLAGSFTKKLEGDGFFHKCSFFTKMLSKMNSRIPGNQNNEVSINSAEELTETGISFKRLKKAKGLFDIEFENKVMKIPEWKIFDTTESSFRNLIAYEDYITGSPQKLVTDYVFFMHCLVNSPKDAKLLRLSRIISNFLGDDEMVYRVINRLHKNITLSRKFSYSDIFNTVNDHCGHERNRWMAKLRREYFNSPWAFISVLAAIILLVLAIIQTTFAILSFRNDFKRN